MRKPSLKRTLLARAKALGATVTYMNGGDITREIVLTAPSGSVWASTGTHDIVANSSDGEPWHPLEVAALDDLGHGVTPCPTDDCEVCG